MENDNNIEVIDIQEKLKDDFRFFVSFVHKRLFNSEFIFSPYNERIIKELNNVYKMKYLLLIINLPPRLGKSQLLIYFNAWTMAKSGETYNNYYTYADLLVNKLYSAMEKIFKIPEVYEMVESTYKRKKEDFSNDKSGGIYAQTTLGQTTGFGAGAKEEEKKFTGVLGIDDPHKASDSITRIATANKAIKSAILNRKNNYFVPIVLIMQRLHKNDLTGYLLDLYSDWFKQGKAYHLTMPVYQEVNGVPKTISKREYPLELIQLEKEKDEHYYWCQLMQQPLNASGKYFKESIFRTTESVDSNRTDIVVYFNPENLTEEMVFLAVKKENKDMVIVDYFEDRLEANSFFKALVDFANLNNGKKIYMPKALITKTVKQELKPLKVEELEDLQNVELSAFYSVGLLKDGNIVLKDDELNRAIKDELMLFPESERDYVVKSVISSLELLFVKGNGRISSSI